MAATIRPPRRERQFKRPSHAFSRSNGAAEVVARPVKVEELVCDTKFCTAHLLGSRHAASSSRLKARPLTTSYRFDYSFDLGYKPSSSLSIAMATELGGILGGSMPWK